MKKLIILIPVFNDWDSLQKLLFKIDDNIKEFKDTIFECLVVNDASTIKQPEIKKPNKISSLKILNMKKNLGHARCNAFGIRYVIQHEKFDNLIIMDGDGEDRPVELISLIDEIKKNPNNSIVAKRVKRSEGPFFRFLYFMHKIITFFFTGEKIYFGNYSCLTKQDIETISTKASLWSSYSGTVKKNLKNLSEIDSIRGVRYFGPSKMSLIKLIIHSLCIIAVFKYQVILRSTFILLVLFFFRTTLGIISPLIMFLLIIFNFTILLVSLREKKEALFSSQENLKDITH